MFSERPQLGPLRTTTQSKKSKKSINQYWHPDGFVGGRGGSLQYRPERSVAKCYGCGVLGHYNKDNRCLPGAKEAYQALQASMQSGQQNQQLAIAGPDRN